MRAMLRLAFVCVASLPSLAQTTWHVDVHGAPPGTGSSNDPYTSIQYALDRPTTLDGDTLAVAQGTYVENLLLSKRVRIEGAAGAGATFLRAAAPGALVRVTAPDTWPQQALLRGFTLDGSAYPDGTGIHVQSGGSASVRVQRCVIKGFTAGRATLVHANSYIDAFSSTIAFNQVGVQVASAISNGVVSLIGCIARFNTNELVGTTEGYNPHSSAIDPSLIPFFSGNIGSDPQLWDPSTGDVHLRPGSPCIDAVPHNLVALDPDGSLADMGAFTFDPAYGWTSYCTSGTTSSGCVPTISAAGVPSAAASSGFTISVSEVEGQKQGHLFYGLSGPHSAPWGTSTHYLCVKAPSQRTGTQDSGGTAGACDGAIALDWCAYVSTHPGALGTPFSPGADVWAQLYFRDPPGPKTTALSDALTFTAVP